MGSRGPTSNVTVEDTLCVFRQTDQPGTPLTAPEVAEELECTRRTVHRKLEKLTEQGELQSKKTGARSRIWWRPLTNGKSPVNHSNTQPELAQFGSFVNAVEDYAIFMLDPEGHVVSWNDGAERIKGYPESEIIGEHVSVFYPDDAVEKGVPEANLEAAAAEGRVEDKGWRVRDDGSQFWADVIITAIRDDDGTLQGFTKVTRDRTEQREYEQQIRRERNLTEQILETVPVGISVLTPDGEFVRANSRTLDRLDVEESDFEEYTANFWDLYDEEGRPIPPDERPWSRAAETGTPIHDYECQVDLPDIGRRWLSINAALLDDERDEDRIVLSVDDITNQKEREQQLKRRKDELESQLREVLGRVSDAFYALDEEWQFTHVNERSEHLLQHSQEELLGESIWNVFPGATETIIWDRFHEAMETQESTGFEIYHSSLDIWVETTAYPSETGLSVYFQDITERKERERKLERYRTIVETVHDGLYTVNPDGTYTMVNEAFTELTGYSREELLGSDGSLIVDDEVAEMAQTLEQDFTDGERDQMMIEAEIKTADGERVPAEATFALLPGEETEYERVGVVRDITERKEQQRALEESERRYRMLVENFPNGAVGLFNEDLEYTAVGGELMEATDVSKEDRIGSSVHEIYPDELVEEIKPYFRAAFEGEANSFEAQLHDRHLLAYTLPIRDATDAIYAVMLVVQDITELKETQQRLEDSNERLEQFAYAASHDLQEPLRMVSSYLQLVEQRYKDELDEDGREFIEFAVNGADRMRKMIDGLLQYSRIETQGDPLEPVALNAVFEEVRDDLEVQIEEHDAEITVESLPRVEGDRSQLRQVFQNLLSNAIEYSGDEPPRVHVSAERAGNEWVISVTDEGVGIDPANQERIFQVFERIEGLNGQTGTGIGLALCDRIVERHGGEIWVESELGEGSMFALTLPAAGETDE